MKRLLTLLLVIAMAATLFAGCANKPAGKSGLKVGMVTDSGTIDDKSFNQGTWEGVQKAKSDLGAETQYLKPSGTTEADYVKEIGNLYDAGYKFIVTPGFKFSTAIYQAQDKYKDGKFVIIDAAPADKDGKSVVASNTVAVFFAEEQSGFIAGVAAALQIKEGEFGFVGGMEIPAVQKYNWGFQQGVDYANKNFQTKITIKKENVVYQGSFDNVAAGQQLAASMYDKGVTAIFAAAGGVGVGVINEAKTRAAAGKKAWVVGVDVDQFADGKYSGEKSVILTSAMKQIKNATFDIIKQNQDGKFPGGQTLLFDAKNNGIGIPDKNPNLSDDTVKKVGDVLKKVQSGEIKVANVQGNLIK